MNETGIYTARTLREMAMNQILQNNKELILDLMSELAASAYYGLTLKTFKCTRFHDTQKTDIVTYLEYKGFKVTENNNYLYVEF